MDQIGFITTVEGDEAKVVVRRTTACGDKCTSCGGTCNVPGVIVTIKNKLDAEPGDYVEIQMKTKSVMKSAFIAYIVPLMTLVSGISLGVVTFKRLGVSNYELYGLLLGMTFLGGSYLLLRVIDNKVKNKTERLTMTRILDK